VPPRIPDVTATPPTTPKPRRRWLQFSLRTLMALVVLLSLPLAWFALKIRKAERQRQAVEAIRKTGGVVVYDYEFEVFANRLAEAKLLGVDMNYGPNEPEPPAPEWLRGLLGVDFFSDVAVVDLTRTHATKEGIEELKRALPNCDILHNNPKDQP
jgi:hypothetical protein